MAIDDLVKKYDKIIKDTLAVNREIIIESFVEYYGEEHRSLIEKRYNQITFVYYVSPVEIDNVINHFLKYGQDQAAKYDQFIEIQEAYQDIQSVPSHYLVGMTNEEMAEKYETSKFIKDMLHYAFYKGCALFNGIMLKKNIYKIVLFPILVLNEGIIIHEINHAIVYDVLANVINKECLRSKEENDRIEKNGNSVDILTPGAPVSEERILDELLNEKASKDITKIFKRRGGDLTPFCLCNEWTVSIYEKNLYLIEEFYERFGCLISYARITLNKNEIVKRVGKENYQQFVDLVNQYYSSEINTDSADYMLRKEEAEDKLRPIMREMAKKEGNSFEYFSDELEQFYQRLREQGYKVTEVGAKRERTK